LKGCGKIWKNYKKRGRSYIKKRYGISRSRKSSFGRNRGRINRRFTGRINRRFRGRFNRRHTRRFNRRSTLRTKTALSTKRTVKRQFYLTPTYTWRHWVWYYNHYSHYPFYNFYWYFYNHYHAHLGHYYTYFLSYHPTITRYFISNKVYFVTGHHPLVIHRHLSKVVTQKYHILRCEKGPKHLLTVNYKNKNYRIFLGDVNDFTNLGCLYFMDTVFTVGKSAYVNRVKKLYNSKKKTLKVKGKKVVVDPFKKSPYRPSNVKAKKLSSNASSLTYKMTRKSSKVSVKKSLLFVHLSNNQVKTKKDVVKVFKALSKHTKQSTSNVLFIADHLQPKSIFVLQHLLRSYKKLSVRIIARIRYRGFRLFSGIYSLRHYYLPHHYHLYLRRLRRHH
jgi:hypothetical protein